MGYAQESPLEGTVTGSDLTEAAKAFDGSMSTYFDPYYYSENYARNWVGLDLGEKYVISRVGIAPASGRADRCLFAVVQGANNADYSDAIPLTIYKESLTAGRMNYIDIDVTRSIPPAWLKSSQRTTSTPTHI